MRSGLVTSLIAHLALIGASLISLAYRAMPDRPDIDALAVDLVTLADLTDISKGRETAPRREAPSVNDIAPTVKPDPTPPAPPPPQPAAAPVVAPPPPDAAATVSPAPPIPSPTPAPPPARTPPTERQAAPRAPSPVPRTRPRPRQDAPTDSRQFTDQITALLDRSNTAPPPSNKNAALGTSNGKEATSALTETEADAIVGYLKSRLNKCWSPPPGAVEQGQIVDAEIFLNIDGTLARPPTLQPRSNGPFAGAAADSARRAIEACVPYRLPATLYEHWRDIEFAFDPSKLATGAL
ncbi:MAG: hypothetical protein U1E56_10960 [Bauldia sp.]